MSDLISRQAAIDGKICIQRANGVEIYDDYAVPVEYLKQLPPIQPVNCSEFPNNSDAISRQAAIDTIEDFPHGDVWNVESMEEMVDRIKQLPPVNNSEKPNSSDAIGRQQAIDAVARVMVIKSRGGRGNQIAEAVDSAKIIIADNILHLPPIQPKRGRWHYSDGKPARIGMSFGVICDQCGTESEYCTNFCGECGADMREVTT